MSGLGAADDRRRLYPGHGVGRRHHGRDPRMDDGKRRPWEGPVRPLDGVRPIAKHGAGDVPREVRLRDGPRCGRVGRLPRRGDPGSSRFPVRTRHRSGAVRGALRRDAQGQRSPLRSPVPDRPERGPALEGGPARGALPGRTHEAGPVRSRDHRGRAAHGVRRRPVQGDRRGEISGRRGRDLARPGRPPRPARRVLPGAELQGRRI